MTMTTWVFGFMMTKYVPTSPTFKVFYSIITCVPKTGKAHRRQGM